MRRKTVMVALMSQGQIVGNPCLMVLKRNWLKWGEWRNVSAETYTGIPEGHYFDLQAVVVNEEYQVRTGVRFDHEVP